MERLAIPLLCFVISIQLTAKTHATNADCGFDYNSTRNNYGGLNNSNITPNNWAFAALKADGSITAWGDPNRGGSGAPEDAGYVKIASSGEAFAALKADGSITAWGDAVTGGIGAPTDSGYVGIASTYSGFAAIKADGSITHWGTTPNAPTDSGYVSIASSDDLFAALKADGSITNISGQDVPNDAGYVSISSTAAAFAALKSDGSITAWGLGNYGGDGEPTDSGYVTIASAQSAFAALKANGSIFAWGVSSRGGSGPPAGAEYIHIASNDFGFAALQTDGSITSWGGNIGPGVAPPTDSGYITIVATSSAFAAMKADGSITSFGGTGDGGGFSPPGSGYLSVASNRSGFAALKSDGSITSWGNVSAGGSGHPTDSGYVSINGVGPNTPTNCSFSRLKPYTNTTSYLSDQIIYTGRTGTGESTEELFALEGKTREKTRLTNNNVADGTPSLSPDGKTIVYASKLDGEWDLYTMNLDSREATNITNTDSSVNEGWPSISPTGGRLLFKRTVNDAETLAVMNTDGGDLTTLLNQQYDHASWSPSGRDIVVSGLDGVGGLTLLPFLEDFGTLGSQETLTQGSYDDYPVFTNDGQYILYASNGCGNGDTKLGVYRYNLVSHESTEILCEANSDYRHFSMMKDGRLLFSRGATKDASVRGVFVTRAPLDWQSSNVSVIEAQLRSAIELSLPNTYSNNPVAIQPYNEVVEQPARPEPRPDLVTPSPAANRKAIVLTHGWNSNIGQWIADRNVSDTSERSEMADKICQKLGASYSLGNEVPPLNNTTFYCRSAADDWHIIVHDWSRESGDIIGFFPRLGVGPWQAYDNAVLEGEVLGNWLKENSFSTVHFIAHSAGARLIETAKDILLEGSPSNTNIHMTFFDAFDKKAIRITNPGPGRSLQFSTYGENAEWVDNYVDTRALGLPDGQIDATKLFMPNAFNVDVSNWDYRSLLANDPFQIVLKRHNWPIEFYDKHTINGLIGFGFSSELGHGLSRESLDTFPAVGRNLRDLCTLPSNDEESTIPVCESTQTILDQEALNQLASATVILDSTYKSQEGTVQIVDSNRELETIQLITGSPAWTTATFETVAEINTLFFDYAFANDVEGFLTVFVDGVKRSSIDERYRDNLVPHTSQLPLGKLDAGQHTISFRLDSFTTDTSQVDISNVQLKRLNTIGTLDLDGDGIANDEDDDIDGDSFANTIDAFPDDSTEWVDNDLDGIGDNIDNDDDNDGFADGIDAFPNDPTRVNLDSDEDGVDDPEDNCTNTANPDQRDTNNDGYGNVCDADLNNDGAVNFADLGLMRSVFFTVDSDADLNGDGAVNFADLGLMKSLFFNPPGPSGTAN